MPTHYVWNGEEVKGSVWVEIDLPDGSCVRPELKGVSILPGDFVAIEFGRSLGTYTETGRSYRAEFPYGKMILHGVGAAIELKAGQMALATLTNSSEEVFQAIQAQQAQRENAHIEQLKAVYIAQEMFRREQKKLREQEQIQSRQKQIRQSLEQMDNFLRKKKI